MSEAPQPITLTDKAATKIKELLGEQENGAEQALRVAVRGGGGAGVE
jgi:Fe-S cluster assembly iron-binding protein IscA